MATGVTPASIEADCSTLVDSLSTLMRCARVSGAPGADDAKGSSSTSSSSSSMSIAPALVPAVAERLVASAASLAGAAAELRRRAALADVSRRVAAVRSSRRRLSSAAEGVQRELDAIADEVAEAVTALDLHLASSAQLPAPRGSVLAYRGGSVRGGGGDDDVGDDVGGGGSGYGDENERLADALCSALGGYF